MGTVRVGLIGTGFGASVVAPGVRCLAGAELVAITSGRLERARAIANEYGVAHAFDDYRAMLREVKPDLVAITAPPYLHHDMTMEAFQAGAHVLCEKPLAMNTAEARAMLAAAERLERVHAVDHEFRFIPARVALTRLLADGEIGEPFLIRISQFRGRGSLVRDGWWQDRALGGGLLQAVGSHYLDAVRLWAGPFAAVQADLRNVAMPGATSDDTVSANFRLQNGVTGSIALSQAVPGGPPRIEIYGTRGALIVEGTILYRAVEGGQEELPLENDDRGRLEDARLGPFVELAQRVVDRINGQDSGTAEQFAQQHAECAAAAAGQSSAAAELQSAAAA